MDFYIENMAFQALLEMEMQQEPTYCLRQKAKGSDFLTAHSSSQLPGEGQGGPILLRCIHTQARPFLAWVTPLTVIKSEWSLHPLTLLWHTNPASF